MQKTSNFFLFFSTHYLYIFLMEFVVPIFVHYSHLIISEKLLLIFHWFLKLSLEKKCPCWFIQDFISLPPCGNETQRKLVRVECVHCPWAAGRNVGGHYRWHFFSSFVLSFFLPGSLLLLPIIAILRSCQVIFIKQKTSSYRWCVKSDILQVNAGIPQGSRLGPLVFKIYMNDIVSVIESDTLIFIDDTSLLATGPDPAMTAA